ncbi:MAG: HAD family hydrolase [Cyanobacteria bacterium]|nr:HAD family hydrolase [Cyanobacteriota bacterium]
MEQKIKAMIFDMDGTLVDSEPLHLMAYQTVLRPLGVEFGENSNQKYLGMKDSEIVVDIGRAFSLSISTDELLQRKDDCFYALAEKEARLIEGVLETIESAREAGLKLAVASSSSMQTIRFITQTLNILQHFDELISGDDVKRGKPAPDIFLLAAARLGLSPSQCIVIEDTDAGVLAAKGAGMTCIAVPCAATEHQNHSEADARIPSLCGFRLIDWF